MLSVKRAHVPELCALEVGDDFRRKQAFDVLLGGQVLDHGGMGEVVINHRRLADFLSVALDDGFGFFGSLGAGVAVDFKIDAGTLFLGLGHEGDSQIDRLIGRGVVVGQLAVHGTVVDRHGGFDRRCEILDGCGIEEATEAQTGLIDQCLDVWEIDPAAVTVETGFLDQGQVFADAFFGPGVSLVEQSPEVYVDD